MSVTTRRSISNRNKLRELLPCHENEHLPYTDQYVKEKPYTLNKQNAVQKKINAVDRTHSTYKHKNGGTVIQFSTTAYENVKTCMLKYYKLEIENGIVSVTM